MSTRKPDPYKLDDAASGGKKAAFAGPPRGEARFDVLEKRGIHIVTLLQANVLDAHEIQELGDDLNKFVARKHAMKVVVDMGGVQHLSSSALGMLITLKSTIEGYGGAVRLANVKDNLKEIFKMTRLDKVIQIKDNVDAAAASL